MKRIKKRLLFFAALVFAIALLFSLIGARTEGVERIDQCGFPFTTPVGAHSKVMWNILPLCMGLICLLETILAVSLSNVSDGKVICGIIKVLVAFSEAAVILFIFVSLGMVGAHPC